MKLSSASEFRIKRIIVRICTWFEFDRGSCDWQIIGELSWESQRVVWADRDYRVALNTFQLINGVRFSRINKLDVSDGAPFIFVAIFRVT